MRAFLLLFCLCAVASADYDYGALAPTPDKPVIDYGSLAPTIPEVLEPEIPSTPVPVYEEPEPSVDLILQPAVDRGPARIVGISATWCGPCQVIKPTVDRAYYDLERQGWKIGTGRNTHIQVLDSDRHRNEIFFLGLQNEPLPFYGLLMEGKVVRQWKNGCASPPDKWMFHWLYTGKDLRPQPIYQSVRSAGYPLRGNWWNVEGDWTPSKSFIIKHLMEVHPKFSSNWLNQLDLKELNSLHSDDHEGRVKWEYVNKYESVTRVASTSRSNPLPKPSYSAPNQFFNPSASCPSCPGGQCPSPAMMGRRRR